MKGREGISGQLACFFDHVRGILQVEIKIYRAGASTLRG